MAQKEIFVYFQHRSGKFFYTYDALPMLKTDKEVLMIVDIATDKVIFVRDDIKAIFAK